MKVKCMLLGVLENINKSCNLFISQTIDNLTLLMKRSLFLFWSCVFMYLNKQGASY